MSQRMGLIQETIAVLELCRKHCPEWLAEEAEEVAEHWRRYDARPGNCAVCGGPVRARGMCSTHYQRWYRAKRKAEGWPVPSGNDYRIRKLIRGAA